MPDIVVRNHGCLAWFPGLAVRESHCSARRGILTSSPCKWIWSALVGSPRTTVCASSSSAPGSLSRLYWALKLASCSSTFFSSASFLARAASRSPRAALSVSDSFAGSGCLSEKRASMRRLAVISASRSS